MIELYYWPTPNGHKITMFLEEAGLRYRIHPVDISAGDQFKPEFLAFSPNNRMPAIIDPSPKTVMEWLFWQMGGLGPMAGQNHHFGIYAPEKIPYAINRYVSETNRLYGVLDRRLNGREFITGSDYTIADMAAYPWVVPWKRQQQDLDDFPNLRGWFDAVRARPATIRAYAAGEPYSNRPAVTEEGKKILFGQTAATSAGP
jgi:GST-like protein